MMVGASFAAPAARDTTPGDVLLEVAGLSLPAPGAFGTPLRDVSLSLRAGEVLGIGGVAGNGQDELLAALSGERLPPRARRHVVQRLPHADGRPRGRRRAPDRNSAGRHDHLHRRWLDC